MEQTKCGALSDWSEWSDEELTRLLYGAIKTLSADPYENETEPYVFEGIVGMAVAELDERGKREWAWGLIDEWDEAN